MGNTFFEEQLVEYSSSTFGGVSVLGDVTIGASPKSDTRYYRVGRVPDELFLKKGVPHQISAGLEILRKFFLAWRFLQFEEHLF